MDPGRSFCSRYILSSRFRISDLHHQQYASPYQQQLQRTAVFRLQNVLPVLYIPPLCNDDNGSTSYQMHILAAAAVFHTDNRNLSGFPDNDVHIRRNTDPRHLPVSDLPIRLLSVPSNDCHPQQQSLFLR